VPYNCNWTGDIGATPDLFHALLPDVFLDDLSVVCYNCNWVECSGKIPGLFYVCGRGGIL